MSESKFLVQFELNFSHTYSLKDITDYVQDKLKAFWTIKNLKISKIK